MQQNHLSNQQLFQEFQHYGKLALHARNKCIALLPEIHKRQIHRAHGFISIHEFAAKYAGLSHEHVNRVLNLEKRLEKLPTLHRALVSGEVGVNKLIKIVSIAQPNNQQDLLDAAKNLSVRAVEQLVRDQKSVHKGCPAVHVNKQMATIEESLQSQTATSTADLQLAPQVKARLLDLQQKGLDLNQILNELLDHREQQIHQEKQQITNQLPQKSSRNIPVKIKAILKEEYGNKCAALNCPKPSEQIHHQERFALFQNHNPFQMKPLCREHHQIEHFIDVKMRQRHLSF